MPKNVSRIKTNSGRIIFKRPTSKFRIGTRKGGKSAMLMSVEELQAVLADEGKRRYFAKAVAVLKLRGVKAEYPKLPVKVTLANVLQG